MIVPAYASNNQRPIVKHQVHREVSLIEYHVSSGSMIVPAGCENRSVRYCSASSPFACAVAMMASSAASKVRHRAVSVKKISRGFLTILT